MIRDPWYKFLEEVNAAKESFQNPSVVWYRGHSNAAWTLISSLYRVPKGVEKEQDIFREFKRSAARLFKSRENDWETLFDMQHYGIPTRLLDWSEVLGVSVAFVTLDELDDDKDSVLYVLDPVGLNRLSGLDDVKNIPASDFDYQSIYWHRKPFAAIYPIAINPPFQNDRMFAQKGTFTVQGTNPKPLEEQCSEVLKKIILPKEAKPGAREFLEHADLSVYTIYPDILGMARYIRKKAFGI